MSDAYRPLSKTGIVSVSDLGLRDQFRDVVSRRRLQNPALTVLDIGGAANPWFDEYVTTYIDLHPVRTDREVLTGDILDDRFWNSIRDRKWDVVVCTHVLEDIRDPAYLIRQIVRVGAVGYVAVPNKHTELSAVESPQYPGYYHHRWVFTVHSGVLFAVAKLPLLGYYRQSNHWLHLLSNGTALMRRIAHRLAPRTIPGGPMFSWFDSTKARHGLELGLIWEHNLEFQYVDQDYCGPDAEAMRHRYAEVLGTGV